MSQTVDIRELNELIASKSSFVNMITMGMDRVIRRAETSGRFSDDWPSFEWPYTAPKVFPGLAKTLAIKTLASLIDATI